MLIERVTEKPREQRVPETKPTFHGICEVCKNNLTCAYVRNPDLPVLQCEEFQGYEPQPAKIVRRRTTVSAGAGSVSSTATPDSSVLKGLCVNCDNRDSCIYPKPEGGVWRCEEYE